MARGLPTSGTITLRQVMGAFSYNASNVVSTSTLTTGTSSVTAPAGAVAAKIEVVGGGGGGRGTYIGAEYGGGGGAYNSLIIPVVGGTTSFNYSIATGGAGGASANGSYGGQSYVTWSGGGIYALGGGGGGITAGSGFGGSADNDITAARVQNATANNGAAGTASAGGGSGSGVAGGSGTTGAAGGIPGGGGAPNNSGTGGAGGRGEVVITWYGLHSSINTLRSFLAGGSYVKAGAAGASRNIPASGTINLRDFISAEEVGMYGNSALSFAQMTTAEDSTSSANCRLLLDVNGSFNTACDYETQNWMRRILGADSATTSQYFDVLFNRTAVAGSGGDTTLYGFTANTWHQVSANVEWSSRATRSTIGTNWSRHDGYLAIRRRSDNLVVANVSASINAIAQVVPAPDTK